MQAALDDYETKYGDFKTFLNERALFKAKYEAALKDHNGKALKHDCLKHKVDTFDLKVTKQIKVNSVV